LQERDGEIGSLVKEIVGDKSDKALGKTFFRTMNRMLGDHWAYVPRNETDRPKLMAPLSPVMDVSVEWQHDPGQTRREIRASLRLEVLHLLLLSMSVCGNLAYIYMSVFGNN